MKLYIKQKVFSLGEKFMVKDEQGNDVFKIEGEFFSIPKRFTIYTPDGHPVIAMTSKIFSFLPTIELSMNGNKIGTIKKDFTLFTHKYTVPEMGLEVSGDFFAHDYVIAQSGRTLAHISKHWFSWGDSYEIECYQPGWEHIMLAIVVTIDFVMSNS